MKLLTRKLWLGTFIGFGSLFAIALSGSQVAKDNAMALNNALGIKTTEVIGEGGSYFKRDYTKVDLLKQHIQQVAEQTEAEGLVLLENNGLLPMADNTKVALFGTASYQFNYNTSGSSATSSSSYPTLKAALTEKGLAVNSNVASFYETGAGALYGRLEEGGTLYKINEVPYAEVASLANGLNGEIAIVTLARNSGEGKDLSTTNSDGVDASYLTLSEAEEDLLRGLTALKATGKVGGIVVLLNSSNPIAVDFMFRDNIDVDALLWVGNVGAYGIHAVAGALRGSINPSGRLTDTFVRNPWGSPAMASWALNSRKLFTAPYSNYKDKDLGLNETNRVFGVYNEGIYVGYRYYETRYYDVVAERPNAGEFNYYDEVGYPFGYGLSYSEFSYSDFSVVESNNDTFKVDVTVTNDGGLPGKHAVQVYLQKPYNDYDVENGIEKSAVELAGFSKTLTLDPGQSEEVSIIIEKERLKSYDANAAKTYILDFGSYLFTVADDAHEAANNFLHFRGIAPVGNDAMVEAYFVADLDTTTFSHSYQTGYEITNQLDHADPNKYEGSGDNHVTYVSRSNWTGTFPVAANVLAIATDKMKADNASNYPLDTTDELMPKYGQPTNLKGVNLHGLEFDDPQWDEFLNSMTFADQANLVTNGNMATITLADYGIPETKAADGPTAVTATFTDSSFPSEGIWASTFNKDLVREIGDCLAEDCLMCDIQALYAPGVNIHRAPYIGRSNEYFSEDPLISGEMAQYEIQGLQGKGVIAHVKHYAFNDEETNRNGVAIWLNEQSAREIYLLPFEYACSRDKGDSHAVMSSFNRVGVKWSGADRNLQVNILQNEWGWKGYTITDMAQSNGGTYMLFNDGLNNGTNLFMLTGSPTALDEWKDNAHFANMVRDSAKRIMYNVINYSANMVAGEIAYKTPWWETTLTALTVTSGILMGCTLIMSIISIVMIRKEF